MLGDTPNTTPSPSSQVDMMFEDVFCISSHDTTPQHTTSPFGFDLSSPGFPMDFTPDFQFPSSSSPSTSKKRKRRDNPDKSRIAQQRRRDTRGQFLRKDVASRLEDLETQLETRESECEALRKKISERDAQVDILKEQLRQLMSQPPPQFNYASYIPVSHPQVMYPVQTTQRNYILVPSPNPGSQFAFQGQEAFKQKIDYSKIQLRKTDSSLDDEKREALSLEEEWEYRQRQQQFMRKLQQEAQWHEFQLQNTPRPPHTSTFGGAPSNIYPETQNKIGNLPVSAFTTKVNLQDKRQQLGKRERSTERLLSDEQKQELTKMVQARIAQQKQLKYQKRDYSPTPHWNTGPITPHSPMETSPMLSSSPSPSINTWNLDTATQYKPASSPPRNLGGPPSNIYPPPEKIGNLQVPAFTTKINYSEIELKKT